MFLPGPRAVMDFRLRKLQEKLWDWVSAQQPFLLKKNRHDLGKLKYQSVKSTSDFGRKKKSN